MPINTGNHFPLDHLLECNRCSATMRLQEGPEPTYHCTGRPDQTNRCGAPAFRARDLNQRLIREVLQVVITDSTRPAFMAEAGGALAEARRRPMEEDELRKIVIDPEWFMAENQAPEAGAVLGRFIDRIRVQPGTAEVEYLIPLPAGTPLAGSLRQDVSLPDSVLA